jgi:hypothetical protein
VIARKGRLRHFSFIHKIYGAVCIMIKKVNYIFISIILCLASICAAFPLHSGGGNKTVKTVFADTADTSPPVIDTSSLELWDGTANIAWYVDNPAAGTELNPYIISNARELAGLSEIVALGDGDTIAYDDGAASPTYGKVGNNYASNGAVATTDFSGKFIKLSNNIYLNAWNGDAAMDADDFSNANNGGAAINWNPISYFGGVFDGNDKKIVGFFQNKGEYSGVFGRIVKSVTIKNLTIASGKISSFGYAGGIAGCLSSNVTITNCVNYGNIASSSFSSSYSGGITGYIPGGANASPDEHFSLKCRNGCTYLEVSIYGLPAILGKYCKKKSVFSVVGNSQYIAWENLDERKERKEDRRCPMCKKAERQMNMGHNRSGTQQRECGGCGRSYTPEPKTIAYGSVKPN